MDRVIQVHPALLLVVPITACGDGASGSAVSVRDSAGVTIMESRAPTWADGVGWIVGPKPVVSIGALDGPRESQLFRVRGATRLPDGGVVVNNSGTVEIRIYGPDGRHVRSLGGEGRGPGQFTWIAWVQYIAPDTLLVGEGSTIRLTRFTLDGTHVETRDLTSPVGPWRGPDARLPDGRFLEYQSQSDPPNPGAGHVRYATAAVAFAEGATTLDTLLTGPGGESFWVESVVGGSRGFANMGVKVGRVGLRAAQGGAVALGDGAEYDVRVRRADGALLRVRRTVERRPVTDADVRNLIETSLERYDESRRPLMRRRMEGTPTSPSMPAYSAVQIDRLGNLWVEAFRAPDDDALRNWSVFDPDGRWLGDVVLPEGLEVFEIGRDYVLGKETDELDVEYVRVYALLKQPG